MLTFRSLKLIPPTGGADDSGKVVLQSSDEETDEESDESSTESTVPYVPAFFFVVSILISSVMTIVSGLHHTKNLPLCHLLALFHLSCLSECFSHLLCNTKCKTLFFPHSVRNKSSSPGVAANNFFNKWLCARKEKRSGITSVDVVTSAPLGISPNPIKCCHLI